MGGSATSQDAGCGRLVRRTVAHHTATHMSLERNPGMPLNLDWVEQVQINRSAVERRAATLPKRRSVKKDWQAAWLLKAVTLMDLTTLAGDDTARAGPAPRRRPAGAARGGRGAAPRAANHPRHRAALRPRRRAASRCGCAGCAPPRPHPETSASPPPPRPRGPGGRGCCTVPEVPHGAGLGKPRATTKRKL